MHLASVMGTLTNACSNKFSHLGKYQHQLRDSSLAAFHRRRMFEFLSNPAGDKSKIIALKMTLMWDDHPETTVDGTTSLVYMVWCTDVWSFAPKLTYPSHRCVNYLGSESSIHSYLIYDWLIDWLIFINCVTNIHAKQFQDTQYNEQLNTYMKKIHKIY